MILRLAVRETQTAVGAGDREKHFHHKVDIQEKWENGTGSGKQDTIWSDRRTISAAENLDLRGGLVSSVDGVTALDFPLVTGLLIQHLGVAGDPYLTIGQGTNPWNTWVSNTGDSLEVPPGAIVLLTSKIEPWTTTATTGDILRVIPASGTISYDVLISGRAS